CREKVPEAGTNIQKHARTHELLDKFGLCQRRTLCALIEVIVDVAVLLEHIGMFGLVNGFATRQPGYASWNLDRTASWTAERFPPLPFAPGFQLRIAHSAREVRHDVVVTTGISIRSGRLPVMGVRS